MTLRERRWIVQLRDSLWSQQAEAAASETGRNSTRGYRQTLYSLDVGGASLHDVLIV